MDTKPKIFSVVIADDDKDDHHFIAEAIVETGIRCSLDSVYDGLQLMDLLYKRQQQQALLPDLILLDLNMPMLNGLGVLKKIKQDEKLKNIPVFVISTSSFEYDRQRSMELGASGFYTKPFRICKLKELVFDVFITAFDCAYIKALAKNNQG